MESTATLPQPQEDDKANRHKLSADCSSPHVIDEDEIQQPIKDSSPTANENNTGPMYKLEHIARAGDIIWKLLVARGKLWCLKSDRVEEHDLEGKIVKSSVSGFQYGRSMDALPSGNILIASWDHGLLIFDNVSDGFHHVQNGQFHDVVCADNDVTIAIKKIGDRVWIVRYREGPKTMVQTSEVLSSLSDSGALTCCMSGKDSDLYVCSFSKNCIYRINEDGVVLNTFGEQGTSSAGMLLEPNLCGHTNGALVVADQGNYRVQMFDIESNRWTILNCENLGYQPLSVVMCASGRVYITGWNPTRLCIYKL